MSELKASENNESVNPADHLRKLNDQIALEKMAIEQLKKEISKVIIGQGEMIDSLIIALLTDGHVLLEGLPGLAKTLTVKTLSQAMSLDFSRIQFTPDLLPADVTGTMIYQQKSESFAVRKGPLFASFILADEINRAPAKVQSALLEAMQERQVTIGEESFKLPDPFLVMATQNPIEQEGTYPLPEAQLDRFMFSINLQYPTFDEEVEVVKRTTSKSNSKVDIIFSAEEILDFQKLIMKIPVADNVINYAVTMVGKSRPDSIGSNSIVKQYVDWGAGPRASQNLILAAKTFAVINNKLSPDIEDVQAVAIGILRHRIIKNYKAESDGISIESIVESLF